MKRIIAVIMTIATLFAMASCSYRVKNELWAENVYTCPSDNMFGLEKVVVFEDGITLVFDKKAMEESELKPFKQLRIDDDMYGYPVDLLDKDHNIPHVKSSFIEDNGKYVASATAYGYEDTSDVVIYGMILFEKTIEVNDGNIALYYEDWETVTDGFLVIRQQFDASSGEWGEVETDFNSSWIEE
ncbi:MAG: hypothetical protein K6E12_05585 [Saccharofermentans sp.]|nr:hypothetical protein [Saccharofermentans sp.]